MLFVAMAFGFALALLGGVAVVVPTALRTIGEPFLTPGGLYVAGALRVLLGVALLVVAARSRTPRILRVLGIVIAVVGLATPLLGVERARTVFEWWTTRGQMVARIWGGVAILLGGFLLVSLAPARRALRS